MIRRLLLIAFVAWMAAWFWVFSFAHSDSYFQYNHKTRFPYLFLALLAVAVPPLSGFAVLRRFFRRTLSALRAAIVHLVVTIIPVFLYWAVYALWVVLARGLRQIAFEADESMGFGFNFGV